MTRLDPDHLDDLPTIVDARIASLSAMLTEWDAHATAIDRYLSVSEKVVIKHRAERLRAEIVWHQELAARLADIIAGERARRPTP
jgi:hypothetical protein